MQMFQKGVHVKQILYRYIHVLFQVNLLLLHHASPVILNKDKKSPLDLACEFGRYRVSWGSARVEGLACVRRFQVNLLLLHYAT